MRALVLCYCLATLCACSSTSSGGTTDDASSDASIDASSDGTGETTGPLTCPSSAPSAGASCDHPGLVCEYGGDAHGACTDLFTCSISKGVAIWGPSPKDPSCGTNPSDCPTSFGASEGTSCTKSGETCDYAEGRCGCEPCSPDGGPLVMHWHCRAWSDAPTGCAAPRPLLGTPCSDEGRQCDWYQCCRGPALGPREQCKDGVWQQYVDTGCSCALPTCP